MLFFAFPQSGQCVVPSYFMGIISECNELYTKGGGDERSFGVSWQSLDRSNGSARSEYTWTDADELNSYPYWGRLGIYSGKLALSVAF